MNINKIAKSIIAFNEQQSNAEILISNIFIDNNRTVDKTLQEIMINNNAFQQMKSYLKKLKQKQNISLLNNLKNKNGTQVLIYLRKLKNFDKAINEIISKINTINDNYIQQNKNVFNGQNIQDIKDPKNGKIIYKFYTEKGSEYLLSDNHMSLRIKSNQGLGDEGLKQWYSNIFFVKSNYDIISSDFDSMIRYAFNHNIKLIANKQNNKLYLYYSKNINGKWTNWIKFINYDEQIRNNHDNTNKVDDSSYLNDISDIPVKDYTVVELNIVNHIIKSYHPGHNVSKVIKF